MDSLESSFHAWTKFLLDENRGKLAQLEIGREVIAAISWGVYRFDSAHASQELQALAGGTEADIKPVHYIVMERGLAETNRRP